MPTPTDIRAALSAAAHTLADPVLRHDDNTVATVAALCRALADAAPESDALCQHHDADVAKLRAKLAKLRAKLAEAKRLGLEACALADEAAGSASEAPDCGEQVADYRQRAVAIRSSMKGL